MFKYKFYKLLRLFHLISRKKFKEKTAKYTKEYKIIARSKFFNKKWYLKRNQDLKIGIDPIQHYLECGWKEGRNPSKKFDGNMYLRKYPDVSILGKCPLIHYELYGKKEKRSLLDEKEIRISKKSIQYKTIRKSKLFNKKYYISHCPFKIKGDPIIHYICQGASLGLNPSKNFDNDAYLSQYPDILLSQINPLYHYLIAGKKEGRNCSKVINTYIDYTQKADILLFSHEFSLTGAPIALLNLGKLLKKMGYSVIILSPYYGDLEGEISKAGISYIIDPHLLCKLYKKDKELLYFLSSFKIILFNTLVALIYAQYVKTSNKRICWIHEGDAGYTSISHVINIKKAFSNIDEVYSVGNYSKSFTDQYIENEKSKILLYGIEDLKVSNSISSNKQLVFGIYGVCCERKGTDLFIQAIKKLPSEVKKNCLFKIVGKIENNCFCRSLKEEANNENVIFTGQLSHDELLKEMAQTDVVVCPSLDDPMPIVCTEAMQLSKTIICSSHTGTAGFIQHGENGFIYNLEKDKLEDILVEVYNSRNRLSKIGESCHKIYLDYFSFSIFERNIEKIFIKENLKKKENQTFENEDQTYIFFKSIEDKFNVLESKIQFYIQRALTVKELHSQVFPKYKNVNQNKDVVLLATGPTLNYYNIEKNRVNVGVNKTFLKCECLDYLFTQDWHVLKFFYKDIVNYQGRNCKKFYGILPEEAELSARTPDFVAEIANAERYFVNLCTDFTPHIETEALFDICSIVFPAMQFILYTKPKKVFLVGCDCSRDGYFNGDKNYLDVSKCVNAWKKLRDFAKIFYQDVEIISINPVGLKGIFHDVYTETYLAEHPEINMKEIEILKEG